jgi:hypothetical protein
MRRHRALDRDGRMAVYSRFERGLDAMPDGDRFLAHLAEYLRLVN